MNILIILIVCTVYSFILYFILRSRIDSNLNNKKFLREVREEISSLVTQINETSDRNVTLLENRLEKLTNLIEQADIRISGLKKEIKVQKVHVIEEIKPESVKVTEPVVKQEKKNDQLDIDLVDDNTALTRKEKIILMHKQGISPSIIASKTDSTVGEVELVISINKG